MVDDQRALSGRYDPAAGIALCGWFPELRPLAGQSQLVNLGHDQQADSGAGVGNAGRGFDWAAWHRSGHSLSNDGGTHCCGQFCDVASNGRRRRSGRRYHCLDDHIHRILQLGWAGDTAICSADLDRLLRGFLAYYRQVSHWCR